MSSRELLIFAVVLLVVVVLIVAWLKKWIKNETLNTLAAIAGIVTGFIALLALLPFVDIEPSPAQTPVSTGTSAATVELTMIPTSPVPTEMPTPSPTPPLIYSWTFEDDYSTTGGWDILSETLGATFYERGEYVVRTKRGNVLFIGRWKDLGKRFENGTLQVRIQRPAFSGTSDTAGIFFGWRDDLEGNSYSFTVGKQGICQFREQSYGGWLLKIAGTAKGFLPELESHEITVVVRNKRAYGYIDGEFCADLDLVAYAEGYVGVVAHSTSEQVDGGMAYFDNFRVAIE